MTPEQIVRALAAADLTVQDHGLTGCALCDRYLPVLTADHEPDCPWRLAVEWVSEQESREWADDETTKRGVRRAAQLAAEAAGCSDHARLARIEAELAMLRGGPPPPSGGTIEG
jgi:hypothetical protein